jgi:hypothetical protein
MPPSIGNLIEVGTVHATFWLTIVKTIDNVITMKNEKVHHILKLVAEADSYEIDNSGTLSGVTISDVTGEPDNEVLLFHWEDAEGNVFEVGFSEKNLLEATSMGDSLLMHDVNGQVAELFLYKHMAMTFDPETLQLVHHFTEDDIRKVCEENGIQFVSRSYGLVTTKTLALHDLTVIVNKVNKT